MATEEFIKSEIFGLSYLIFRFGIKYDPEGFGYIAFDGDGQDRAPRFGKPMEEAIQLINKFVHRHYGESPEEFNGPVIILGIGIGGQSTCAIPALGFIVRHNNRRLIVLDSLGANYRELEKGLLDNLRADPRTKLLWVVGSKSGATDETMLNFQMSLKMMLRVWAKSMYGDVWGDIIAGNLITKLFDGRPLFEKKLKELYLMESQLELLQTVFKNLVIVTGKWDKEKNKGSRLDRLVKEAFINELFEKEEDKVVSIVMLDNLGGRFQGISPNSFVYNALLGLDIQAMLEVAKDEATRQRNDSYYRSKQIAIDLRTEGINRLLIAIPNDFSLFPHILQM